MCPGAGICEMQSVFWVQSNSQLLSIDFIRKDTESISSDFDILELKDSGTQVVLSFFPIKLYDSIKILREFFLIHKRSVTSEGV